MFKKYILLIAILVGVSNLPAIDQQKAEAKIAIIRQQIENDMQLMQHKLNAVKCDQYLDSLKQAMQEHDDAKTISHFPLIKYFCPSDIYDAWITTYHNFSEDDENDSE